MQFYGISVMRPYKQSGRRQDVLDFQAPLIKVSLPCSLRPEALISIIILQFHILILRCVLLSFLHFSSSGFEIIFHKK